MGYKEMQGRYRLAANQERNGVIMMSPTTVIVSVSLMLFGGYLMTRLTKLAKLPNVTGYILAGILLGPYCLKLIPAQIIEGMDFLSDIALAFIAFSAGEFFRVSALKSNGVKVLVITVLEACMASVLVFIATYLVMDLGMAFSITLSALAAATAPASTLMTIRQTHAHGDLVDTLLQVVALDDVVGLVAYSIAISVALSSISGKAAGNGFEMIVRPILVNLGVLLLGGLFGLLLKFSMGRKHSTDNRLIIAVGLLFLFCGVCSYLDVSPLLGCMSMSTVYVNVSDDDKLFKQLNYFSPPILLLFFVRSGLNFRLEALFSPNSAVQGVPLIQISIIYFILRILGKYGGAYLGCMVTKKDVSVRNYLGLALVPQAGVAIGLAAMCARVLGEGIGTDLQTIILASSVLYEMIGPVCAKLALYLSHSYSDKLEDLTEVAEVTESGQPRPAVEILIDRIQQIQQELPARPREWMSEEERAFQSAADEQSDNLGFALRTRPGHFAY